MAKDAGGKMTEVDKKPGNAGMIVKGPFQSMGEAKKAMADAKRGDKWLRHKPVGL
ncbi:hypothetical protein ACFL2Q_15575 [Thermodesulfobacteriota bacterium]